MANFSLIISSIAVALMVGGGVYEVLSSCRSSSPNLPGEITVTVTLKPVSMGTEVNIVQEGLPDAIPLRDPESIR